MGKYLPISNFNLTYSFGYMGSDPQVFAKMCVKGKGVKIYPIDSKHLTTPVWTCGVDASIS